MEPGAANAPRPSGREAALWPPAVVDRKMIRQIIIGSLFCLLAVAARADDWLEFQNGERLVGHYVRTQAGVITFQSTRFGELHVSTREASVKLGPPKTTARAPAKAATVLSGAAAEATGHAALAGPQTTAAPPVIAATVRHNWTIRVDTLFDFVWDNNRNNSRETKLQGTGERLSGKEHYLVYSNLDYLYNKNLLVQNRVEGKFTWEHQLSHSFYSIAEPDYLREIRQSTIYQYQVRTGLGTQLFQTDRSQVRLAVLAYFSRLDIPAVHSLDYDVYPTIRIDSEWEIWRGLKFKQEGNAFYIPRSGTGGVDNTMSLTKEIFGGFTLTLQHEYHHELIPNASITRNELRLLLGYTF